MTRVSRTATVARCVAPAKINVSLSCAVMNMLRTAASTCHQSVGGERLHWQLGLWGEPLGIWRGAAAAAQVRRRLRAWARPREQPWCLTATNEQNMNRKGFSSVGRCAPRTVGVALPVGVAAPLLQDAVHGHVRDDVLCSCMHGTACVTRNPHVQAQHERASPANERWVALQLLHQLLRVHTSQWVQLIRGVQNVRNDGFHLRGLVDLFPVALNVTGCA